ncbi:MAG: F0F1 ATP synthase subunit B [Planctomycetota bacterium]
MPSFSLIASISPLLAEATEAAHGAAEHHAPGLMDMEISLIFWTWVSFAVLALLLWKFAWGPIQKLLNERAEKIEGEVEKARKIREDAEKALAEYTVKLEKIREEAEQLMEKSRAQGEELKKQLEAKGKQEAEEIRERATKEIDLMMVKARAELRTVVADLAVKAAETVVGRSLTDADHKRYAEEAITALGSLDNKN